MDPASIVTALSAVAELPVKVRAVLSLATRWLLRPVIAVTAAVTVPCMLGPVSPVAIIEVGQVWARRVTGANIDATLVAQKLQWMAAHTELGAHCAVFAFLAGLATFRGSRLRDWTLASAWLAAFAATLSGHGRPLLGSFVISFWVLELAVALLPNHVPDAVMFIRYPMRLTMAQPFRYLLTPVVHYVRGVGGYEEDAVAVLTNGLPDGIRPTDSATQTMMRISRRRMQL